MRLFSSFLVLSLLAPAAAADSLGRLTLDIKISSEGRTQRGLDSSHSKSEQEMHLRLALKTTGDREDTNRNDIAGNAAKMQKNVDDARAKMPDVATQKDMQIRMRDAMQACGADINCINKVAGKFANDTKAWQAKPVDNSADEGRFLTYFGYPGCSIDFSARINTNTDGVYPDVQGMVPFTEKRTADYRATAEQARLLCGRFDYLVVDTRTNTIHATIADLRVPGKIVYSAAGHTRETPETEMQLHGDALKWVREKLKSAPLSGKDRVSLTLPPEEGAKGERKVTVELSWRFEAQ